MVVVVVVVVIVVVGEACYASSTIFDTSVSLFCMPKPWYDPKQFEDSFMEILSRCHGTKRVRANIVYGE